MTGRERAGAGKGARGRPPGTGERLETSKREGPAPAPHPPPFPRRPPMNAVPSCAGEARAISRPSCAPATQETNLSARRTRERRGETSALRRGRRMG
eukprot:scaffold6950_cov229-Prasinococcus_capsulatus_cf.AAC.1